MKSKLVKLILAKIEAMGDDVVAYAYREMMGDGRFTLHIAVNSYDLYFSKQFREFASKQHKLFDSIGERFVFVCCNPNKKMIDTLYSNGNLIVNL